MRCRSEAAASLGELARSVRSKNAGPFTVTVDIFCGSAAAYARIRALLTSERVAGVYRVEAERVRRFELPDLHVLKFSFPRPIRQGSRLDRDMHAAQYAVLLEELEVG